MMDDENRISLETLLAFVPPYLRSLDFVSVEPDKSGGWTIKWKIEVIRDREKIKKATCEFVDSILEEVEKRLKSG